MPSTFWSTTRAGFVRLGGGTHDTVVRKFELNFFSVVAIIRAMLPGMRRRRGGLILNVSSAAGLAA